MREIFFRGQTRRKGQKVWMDGSPVESNWVYGGVCHGTGDFSIIYGNLDEERERPTEKWVVYTDTVGQFTGLTDKNGKKIFEGDIVRDSNNFVGIVEFGTGTFDSGVYCYTGWHRRERDGCVDHTELHDYGWPKEFEVIGNIHDNPELLGGAGGG